MRAMLRLGTYNKKQIFQPGYPGHNWIFGPEQLHARFLASSPLGQPVGTDVRCWQPLVPLLIRSFQLARDILLDLPHCDHAALKEQLYTKGLRVPLGLLICFGGAAAGQVWRLRCGLEAMRLALDPEGAVQRNLGLRGDMELRLLDSAVHCMNSSIGKFGPVPVYVSVLTRVLSLRSCLLRVSPSWFVGPY